MLTQVQNRNVFLLIRSWSSTSTTLAHWHGAQFRKQKIAGCWSVVPPRGCSKSRSTHTTPHITDPLQSHWNYGGLAFLSKSERCNSTTSLWAFLKQWPRVPVLSGGTIWLAFISTYLWFTFSSQKQFQTTKPTTAVFRNKHFLSFGIKHQRPLEYGKNATNELGF